MNSIEYRKKIENKIEIEMNLEDINTYVKSALDYLREPSKEKDKEEIIMYLSTIPEIISEIKELTRKEEKENE